MRSHNNQFTDRLFKCSFPDNDVCVSCSVSKAAYRVFINLNHTHYHIAYGQILLYIFFIIITLLL